MKLKEDIDFIAFLRTVKKCRKDVYFDSPEGDHLDLKSVLSQYVLSANAHNTAILREGNVRCYEEKDYEILREYLVNG